MIVWIGFAIILIGAIALLFSGAIFAIILYFLFPLVILSIAESTKRPVIRFLCYASFCLYFFILTANTVEHRYDSEGNFTVIDESYPLNRKSIKPGENDYLENIRLVYDKRGGIFWDAEPSSSNRYISRFSLWPERFNYNDAVMECSAKGGRLPSQKEAMRLYNKSNNPGYDFHKFKIELWPFGRVWWYFSPMFAYIGPEIIFKDGLLKINYNFFRVFNKKQSAYDVEWFKNDDDYKRLRTVLCVYPIKRFPDLKDKIKSLK